MRRAVLMMLAALGCATSPESGSDPFVGLAREAVGAGHVLTGLPPGEKGPSDKTGAPARPKVAPGFTGAPPTNDWWSSLIWAYEPGARFSQPMFAHPLALQAEAAGLGVAHPTVPVVDDRHYDFPFHKELRLGVDGLAAPETTVQNASDWVVTASWRQGARALEATFGHGLPYVYARAFGDRPVVEVSGATRISGEGSDTLAVTVNDHSYGVFLPTGARWIRSGERFEGPLPGRRGAIAFSVAVLPDATPATLARFRAHAFAFVTDSRVSWRYDEPSATLTTRFALTTRREDPARSDQPLIALYPHHARQAEIGRGLGSYTSPRGPMTLIEATSFETRLPFTGVLPILPPVSNPGAGPDPDILRAEIRAARQDGELFPAGPEGTRGTYWSGKAMQKVALLVWLADRVGDTEAREGLVRALEAEIARWFDGRGPRGFAYDPTWHALIGVPSEYRSGWELNDHHFHYGYFVFTAATLARFDPAWAARWRGMVDLLIADVANADRDDARFPFLRAFDPYAGHSWANGPALFARGNNEESSSEEMNFAAGAFLWGAVTGDRATRDLGVFLYAQAATAIEQYWFDVDRCNFPANFTRSAVAIVWGSGGAYETWWDPNPVYVHAINFLPFTGASLYLGRRPAYVSANQAGLRHAVEGEIRLWRDLVWMHLALVEPDRAVAAFEKDHHFDPERGNSWAFAYHWIYSLRALGQVDPAVTADAPTYAVLRKGDVRTHAAFNPGPGVRRVTFSDGVAIDVPAGETRTAVGGTR